MRYFLNLFSPETYEAFTNSDQSVSGFRIRQRTAASRIDVGDRFICYMTKLSRWIGILDVVGGPYEDDTPIFYAEDDPFVVRFDVEPVAWLEKEKAIPIHEDRVWDSLSFTEAHDKHTSTWTGKIRSSLRQMDEDNAQFLEELILDQAGNGATYEIDAQEYQKLVSHRVRRLDKVVSVSVPEEAEEAKTAPEEVQTEVRESIQVQARIADLGAMMGLKIWIPTRDRARVVEQMSEDDAPLLNILPLNYDDTTLKTVEQIDVLWLRGRAIIRAFEVEHTTSIYSGILRMADLLALQPNMDINLHIVAPYRRRDKVFTELRRPVFSLLDRGPLAESCTYVSYESLGELVEIPHLTHTSDTILDEFAEEAE